MRRLLLSLSVATFLVSLSLSAHAASYTLVIGGVDNGTLTVTGSGSGGDASSVLLASGGGTIDGDAVVLVPGSSSWLVNSLATPSSTNFFTDPNSDNGTFDDELYPSLSPYVDDYGLEFEGTGVNSDLYFFLYSSNVPPEVPTGLLIWNNSGSKGSEVSNNADSIALAPEPSSLMLLGTGILGLAGVARRKLFATA